MKRKSNNKFTNHKAYPKSVEHALRAINEGVIVKVDGEIYEYDKQHNTLSISNDFMTIKYTPKFKVIDNITYCDPFCIDDDLNTKVFLWK